MRIFLPFFFTSLLLCSCVHSTECTGSENLLGNYILDISLASNYNNNNNEIPLLIRKNKWDKVNLIVKEGRYYFENCDDFFHRYEGTWKYMHLGIDGDCYIFINQKNASRDTALPSFNIAIEYDNEKIILPFRKK
jgi:hypothetical protein